ncbi:MAG: hypothetical protein WCW27_04580 [Patescibacteria group bacterium]|jgi:hypothetical protein
MAKRRRSLSALKTRNKKHPRKTKKRLAVKAVMLAKKAAKFPMQKKRK